MESKAHGYRLTEQGITLHYSLSRLGEDLLLVVTGGQAHIGAVVVAEARDSLLGEGKSATESVLNLPTHQEEQILRPLARRLCLLSGKTVCALGGAHFEPFDQSVLDSVMKIHARALEAAPTWLEELK